MGDTTKEEEEGQRRRGKVSFSIWPPSEKTREAVRSRLVETLSKPSILSKRYGTMPSSDAEDSAHRIEAEAYLSASSSNSSVVEEEGEDGGGMEVLQAYSKEISRLMLDAIKSISSSSPPPDDDVVPVNDDVVKVKEDDVSVEEN